MGQKFWAFDTVTVDLEDRDATVTLVHFLTHAEVKICFRLTEEQLAGPASSLKSRLQTIAADRLLDLSSFLDHHLW